MDIKYVTLGQIFKEMFEKRDKLTATDDYETFKKDNTKKLKAIMKSLGIDISNYMSEKNEYKIPEIVADIFKIFLSENSSKGSTVSKIKSGKISTITSEEKKRFLEVVIERLKDTNKYNNNELEEFFEFKIHEVDYNDEVLEQLSTIKKKINSNIDYQINRLTQINELDGLIIVNDKINEQIDFKGINFQDIEYENDDMLREPDVLSEADRIVLSQYLSKMLDETLDNWNKVVRIANNIKNASIDDEADDIFNNKNIDDNSVLSGKKLLEEAIKDFEEELKKVYRGKEQFECDEETEEFLKNLNK